MIDKITGFKPDYNMCSVSFFYSFGGFEMVVWKKVLDEGSSFNEEAVIDFVEGSLNLRDFKKGLDDDARREINRVASRGTDYCRHLARKALRRRNVSYTLVG